MSFQIAKPPELNSNISTNYSQNGPRTPLSLNMLHSRGNLGYKKFTRKKDNSIDTLRKCLQQKITPKAVNNKKEDIDGIFKTLDSIPESQVCRIIKTNNFIKLVDHTSLTQRFQSIQIDKVSLRTTQQIKSQKNKEKNNFQRNSSQFKKTEQKKPKIPTQQIEGFSSPIDQDKTHLDIQRKKMSKTINFETSYTDREKNKKVKLSQNNDIKVLQNQILILEDENQRLKKHISLLTNENQEEKYKKSELQKYVKELQNKLLHKRQYQTAFIQIIIKNIHQIYLQISQIIQSNRGRIQSISQSDNKAHWQGILSFSKKKIQPTMQNFIQIFMQPAIQVIKQKIKQYSKLFQHSKVELNKLQIRQNVMMRSTFQLQNSRVQNRMLNEKLSVQRSKSLKFKNMYETLKKKQIEQSKGFDKSKKILSQKNLLMSHKSSKGNQQTSLILSDLSDDQQPRRNSKKIDKKNI